MNKEQLKLKNLQLATIEYILKCKWRRMIIDDALTCIGLDLSGNAEHDYESSLYDVIFDSFDIPPDNCADMNHEDESEEYYCRDSLDCIFFEVEFDKIDFKKIDFKAKAIAVYNQLYKISADYSSIHLAKKHLSNKSHDA